MVYLSFILWRACIWYEKTMYRISKVFDDTVSYSHQTVKQFLKLNDVGIDLIRTEKKKKKWEVKVPLCFEEVN